jgi:hypothetical protein
MKQLRGPKHENWPVCDPRAAPAGEYGLKSGENGHLALARPNGAIDGPYCSPTWSSVFGRRCEPLAGRGGWFGGGAAPAPACGACVVGRFFNPSECLRKTRGAQAVRHCAHGTVPEGLARMAKLAPLFPGGPGGGKPLLFTTHGPCQMCKKRAPNVHVTRW